MTSKAWSSAEMQILRGISASAKSLESQMHLLPGRTHSAVKCFASKHKIKLPVRNCWSDDEIAVLRRVWRSKKALKAALAKHLPHRTYAAARSEAQRIGLTEPSKGGRTGRSGYSWLKPAIDALLRAGDPLTVDQLVQATGANWKSVGRVLEAGHRKTYRVAGWKRCDNAWARCWEIGKRPDEPKPSPKPRTEVNRAARARRIIRQETAFNPFSVLIHQVAT